MDSTHSMFDWIKNNPELKGYNVLLMCDRDATISRGFGVLQRSFSSGQVNQSSKPSILTPKLKMHYFRSHITIF